MMMFMTQKEKEQDRQDALERSPLEKKIEALIDEVLDNAGIDRIGPPIWVRMTEPPDPPSAYLDTRFRKELIEKYARLMMMNQNNTIHFKSIPENYEKEKDGRKPNTLRTLQSYTEHLFSEETEPKIIIIENSETGAFFTRQITDITIWQGWVIISWRHE